MARIEIEIEDYLDEVDEETLIIELRKRSSSRLRETIKELFEMEDLNMDTAMKIAGVESLSDRIKFEAFIEKFKDIPEADLDRFLEKY